MQLFLSRACINKGALRAEFGALVDWSVSKKLGSVRILRARDYSYCHTKISNFQPCLAAPQLSGALYVLPTILSSVLQGH